MITKTPDEKYRFEVLVERPPMWDEVAAAFELAGHTPVFAYGDALYNPYNVPLPQDLLVHEAVHMGQQDHTRVGAGLWWKRYILDSDFRVAQEVEAFGAQYRWACGNVSKDRNKRARWLNLMATSLSGPMYGSPISRGEALSRIRKESGIIR